jgi:DNA-binding IclR family transcriptional regulator
LSRAGWHGRGHALAQACVLLDALDCHAGLTVRELGDRLEVELRTAYRYLRAAHDVGLCEAVDANLRPARYRLRPGALARARRHPIG